MPYDYSKIKKWTAGPPDALEVGMIVEYENGCVFMIGDLNIYGSDSSCGKVASDIIQWAWHPDFEPGGEPMYHKLPDENFKEIFLMLDCMSPEAVIAGFIIQYGGTDGAHHKQWVFDQILRYIAQENYDKLIAWANDGEDGPNTYSWDEGIAP